MLVKKVIIMLKFLIKELYNTSVLEKNETDDSIISRVKRTMLADLPFKWTFPIQYTIGPGLDAATIQRGLSLLSKETCLSFTRVSHFTKPGLSFVHGPECASFIGRVSLTRPQEITLNEECNYVTAVQHETSHALGVIHEFGRPDRDNHLTVNKDNIESKALKNFETNEASKILTYDLKFDHGSVMNYDRYAFSHNNKPTIDTKDPHYSQTMG
uniref:Metalloendopeptidase n=1 Tax=Parastrongyloides trichosuri TaxID=131310 RepID=A0A0N4Z442_PARTI